MRLSMYTLVTRDFSLEESLEMAARAGFEAVDLRQGRAEDDSIHLSRTISDAEAEAVGGQVEEAGLHVSGLTSYYCLGYTDDAKAQEELDGLQRALTLAGILGGGFLRCSGPRLDWGQNYEPTRAAFRAQVEQVAEMAAAAGVTLTIEQHGGTFVASAGQILDMLRGLEHERLGIVYDPGNTLSEGYENPGVQIDMMRTLIKALHVKNAMTISGEVRWGWMPNEARRLDEGLLDWPEILRRLHEVGYDGYVTLEDFYGGFESKQEQLDWDAAYLRGIVEAL